MYYKAVKKQYLVKFMPFSIISSKIYFTIVKFKLFTPNKCRQLLNTLVQLTTFYVK